LGPLELTVLERTQLGSNASVKVGFRPEEVRGRNVESGSENRVEVRVKLVDFLGPFCRATMQIEVAPHVTFFADFSANAARDLEIRQGQVIAVVLPPEALRVFPAPRELRQ
jgi:iron(III) transport system ATP-binding protein